MPQDNTESLYWNSKILQSDFAPAEPQQTYTVPTKSQQNELAEQLRALQGEVAELRAAKQQVQQAPKPHAKKVAEKTSAQTLTALPRQQQPVRLSEMNLPQSIELTPETIAALQAVIDRP